MTDEKDNAAPFRDVADSIDHNKHAGFSGAACIVPPGEGKHLTLLFLRNVEDAISFWSQIKTYAEMAIAELAQAEQQARWPGR